MENDPAASVFNKFANFFNHTEKTETQILTEDTPVLAFFHSLSEKSIAVGNSSVQKPQTDGYHSDSTVEKDAKDDKGMEIASQSTNSSSTETPFEKEVSVEAEAGLTRTGKHREQCSTHTNLEKWSDNNVETEVSNSMDQKKTRELASQTERELLDMDLQANIHQGNSCKEISSACQAEQEVADGQTDVLSRALSLESLSTSLSNSVTAKSHSSGNLSDISQVHTTKQTVLVNNTEKSPENTKNINVNYEDAASNENMCEFNENPIICENSAIPGLSTNVSNEEMFSTTLDESKHQGKTNELICTHSETPDTLSISKNKERLVSFANIDNPASIKEDSISSTKNNKELYRGTNDQEVSTDGSNLVLSNGNLVTDVRFPTRETSSDHSNYKSFTGMSDHDTITVQEGQAPHTTDPNFLSASPPVYSRTMAITLSVDVDAISEHSNVGGTSVQPGVEIRNEEAHSSFNPEMCNGGSIDRQFISEDDPLPTTPQDTSPSCLAEVREAAISSSQVTEEGHGSSDLDTSTKYKPDQMLLKLEPAAPDNQNETQGEREMTEDGQEARKLEMEKKERKEMEDVKDDLVQREGENNTHKERAPTGMMKEEEGDVSLDIPSTSGNPQDQPTTENASGLTPDSTSSQAILSPSPVLEKPHQLPFLFTGLRELKKESDEQQKVEAAPEKPKGPDLMKQRSVKRGLFSDQRSKKDSKGSFLEQLSQLLSFDASKLEIKREPKTAASPLLSPIKQDPAAEKLATDETVEEPNVTSSEGNSKSPSAETALDAFKAFFTPKPLKRDTSDRIDLETVKRTLNKEAIRAIFDRSSSKSPDNKNVSDSKPESEERTPGRLQAIWPPPKPKDKEEKIGLKYTEAEHQAALLQLKRECKEEVETLEADFKLQLFRLREENAESVSRLQSAIAELKEKAKRSRSDLQDVAVSTEDGVTPRAFRTVCIQTDRETFIKAVEDAELSSGLCPQPNVPKKLNLTTINLGLSGKHPVAKQEQPPPLLPPPPPPLPVQPDFDSSRAPPPPPVLPGSCDGNGFSKPAQSLERLSPPEKGNGPPPPPPPPPTAGSGPPPPPPILGSAPSPPTGVGLFFSRAEEWPERRPRVEPVCPMKPLYWTRIQIQNNRNDTLWSSLKEPAIINTNEFAELFSKMSSPAKRKPLSEAYEKKAKSKKIIKLLDGKRSQAVGILISSLHLDMKDIQQAVLMLDNSVVDLDAIEALYENRAQPEELERIRKHYETSDEEQVKLLDKPEQFLYELSRIPEFSLRARCIILQSTFADAIASIKHKTEIVFHVCEELLERNSVRGVLGLVLALGNYMNGGSRTRGQADGFGLDILPKLKDVKSRDNRMSLLDYMVSYYARNLDENAGTENCIFPLPEPQDVFLAAQVKFEDLTKELRKLGKDLADCEKDVRSVCSKTLPIYIHPFKEKMEAFIATAQNERTATEHRLISAQKSFRDLVEYFGLKPRSGEQDVLPGHVFMLWFEFCNDFKTRWKRENKTISKERLKEAQQSVRNITAEKKVETRRVHAHGLKERLRLKEASQSSA